MSEPDRHDLLSRIQKTSQLIAEGNDNDARVIFDQLARSSISEPNILAQLGTLALQFNDAPVAIDIFSRVNEQEPDNANYLNMLANAMITNRDFDDAKNILSEAIEIKPDFVDLYKKLGAIAVEQMDYAEGSRLLEKALELKPRDPAIVSNIIVALRYTDRHDDALNYARKLVRLDPKNPNSHESLSKVLVELGNPVEATTSLEKAIRLDKTRGSSYNLLTSTRKFSEKDSGFIKQCEHALTLGMPSSQRYLIHFALGKVYDDCKKWGKAFEHYRQGNLLHKPATNKNKAATDRLSKTQKYYNPELFKQASGLGNKSDIPVFIVGMPRSGTTLIEQIICSHPEGAGAGELAAIGQIAKKMCSTGSPSDYKKQLHKNLTADTIRLHTDNYLKALKHNRQHAKRIVDKMPDNFFNLGLINLLFPNSHIIHAIRSPLDTCLSCYFRPFTFAYWTYDLKWIASRYRFYRKTMEYWKKNLPEGRIIDVHYEKLIQDPGNQTRSIIENIGLPWDQQCLEFHKTKRAITTESALQVRQPIYTSSKRRWINYAQFLQELANELSDYFSAEEIEELNDHGIKISAYKRGRRYFKNILAK